MRTKLQVTADLMRVRAGLQHCGKRFEALDVDSFTFERQWTELTAEWRVWQRVLGWLRAELRVSL